MDASGSDVQTGEYVSSTSSQPQLVCSLPRSNRGGGLAIIYRDSLSRYLGFVTDFAFTHLSFEVVHLSLSVPQHNIHLICIYRTFPSKKNKLTDAMFHQEFPGLLDYCNTLSGTYIVLGDINFHFDQPQHPSTAKMIELLDQFSLSQSVTEPTHNRGHIIDWIMYRPQDGVVRSTSVTQELSSDHFCVVCDLSVAAPPPPPMFREVRSLRTIDRDAFKQELADKATPELCPTMIQLDSTLHAVLDRHAPVARKKVKATRSAPWYKSVKDELSEAKKHRRKAEKKWLKSGLEVGRQIFAAAKKRVTKIVQTAKTRYFSDKISSSETSKQLFDVCNQLRGKTNANSLPSTHPPYQLPDVFCNYFTQKVADIRATFDSHETPPNDPPPPSLTTAKFKVFQPVSEQEVKKVILSSKPTSCSLDPIPTPLLIENLDPLLPTITHIINESLSSGVFPSVLKAAVIKPLLKKPSLDKNNLKNYRPVSNLSFLSKIIEKIVLKQLFAYLNDNALLSPNQSAYRPFHSTETALLKVTNDLLLALDNGNVSILTLLDLSAAFDTVDHHILLNTLQHYFGISGSVLAWFQSYIFDRSQVVTVDGCLSSTADLVCGVPQGSVLGPVLFTLYTKPLLLLLGKQAVESQSFADDTQLYKSTAPSLIDSTVKTVENCINDIKLWMTLNKLKLNDDKTEALLIHKHNTSSSLSSLPTSLTVGTTDIHFSSSARNLGYILSDDLSLNNHISHVCRSAYTAIRQISSFRHYLTVTATKTLVCALVLSRLDYCNSLLAGSPKHIIDKLQKVQNSAARLVFRAKKHDHITFLLHFLHWLPVQARIEYKLSVLCHNFFSDSCPSYLADLLSVYSPSRTLRSSADIRILKVPVTAPRRTANVCHCVLMRVVVCV